MRTTEVCELGFGTKRPTPRIQRQRDVRTCPCIPACPLAACPLRCRIVAVLDQAAPLRGAGSGAPRAGLWPWEAPPGAPAPSQPGTTADLAC